MADRLILFDLDGTLTASAPGILNCVQYALSRMGFPEYDRKELQCFVGPPLKAQFMSFTGMNDASGEEAVRLFRERYIPVGKFENSVYTGIPEMLDDLHEKGMLLGVASSKPEITVREILEHFELLEKFDFVVGASMDGSLVEKPDIIEKILKLAGFDSARQHVWMVGDRRFDISGARECGCTGVGAAYGYGGREELQEAGADYIADSVEDLHEFLKNI